MVLDHDGIPREITPDKLGEPDPRPARDPERQSQHLVEVAVVDRALPVHRDKGAAHHGAEILLAVGLAQQLHVGVELSPRDERRAESGDRHVHGTDNARCLIAMSMMTGQIGRPGTGLHPLRGQNNVQGASDVGLIPMMLPDYMRVDDPAARAKFESLWGTTLDPKPGLTVVEIMDAVHAGPIRGMYIMGENPA